MNEPIKNQEEELAWLGRRKDGVGSSESPVISLGAVYDTKPVDVYIDKKTPAKIEPTDNPHFRRGHTYEPLALAMYKAQTGRSIFEPLNDTERYNKFQLFHPELPVFSDLDAVCSDGWVLEVKCPSQRMFDLIMAEGVRDYYQVQAHHHNGVVQALGQLPGLGDVEVKGTRLIIYAPESIELFTFEIPYDAATSDAIFEKCSTFWTKHVLAGVPPTEPEPDPVVLPKKGGVYTVVKGEAWEKAAGDYLFAREMENVAKARKKRAKAILESAMRAAKLDLVQLRKSGVKFNNALRAGNKTLDKKALQAAHPEVDLDRFTKQGKPFRNFGVYGTAPTSYDETLDGAVGSLGEQLRFFAVRDLDPELAAAEFADLEAKYEAYVGILEGEIGELDTAMESARRAAEAKK